MRKIIVVEDSSIIRDQLRERFIVEGFDLIEAEDGLIGIQAITENPDCLLIIVDLHMPNMGGLEMLEEIYNKKLCLEKPKIIFTSDGILKDKSSRQMKIVGKEYGVKSWFTKPLTAKRLDILVGTIKKIIKVYE